MATKWKITADSEPVLDGWGWAEFWPVETWQQWHGMLKAKFGKEEANRRFLEYWHKQDSDANPFNQRSFNANFRKYARENGFFDGLFTGIGAIAKPLGWITDILHTADKVEAGATGAIQDTAAGIGTTGKVLKYAIPAAIVLILAAGAFYLYNKSK
ncbi:MAG: hypothetical protein NTW16_00750 [Bacteroidetes bacterium]|nr:hypothetical protein [Bacteroidota bacterium]